MYRMGREHFPRRKHLNGVETGAKVNRGYSGRGNIKHTSLELSVVTGMRNIKETNGQNESVSKRQTNGE